MGAGAILGGVLGFGGSILSSRSHIRAADRAAESAQAISRDQIGLARDIYNDQAELLEPFRQQEIQRANALGEVFGFDPVGQGVGRAPPNTPGFAGGSFGGDGQVFPSMGYDDLRVPTGGSPNVARRVAGMMGGVGNPSSTMQPDAGAAEPITMESQQDRARERFEGSMFNDVYRDGHQRDVTRIDSGLASQGMAFSGARTQAVEDARADRFGSTFNSYLAGLMGQAPTTATQSTNNAGSQFSVTASNSLGNLGVAQQQSAYQRGQAGSNFWGSVAGLGGYAMGGGFGG